MVGPTHSRPCYLYRQWMCEFLKPSSKSSHDVYIMSTKGTNPTPHYHECICHQLTMIQAAARVSRALPWFATLPKTCRLDKPHQRRSEADLLQYPMSRMGSVGVGGTVGGNRFVSWIYNWRKANKNQQENNPTISVVKVTTRLCFHRLSTLIMKFVLHHRSFSRAWPY